eukprot:gnl/TRDRNA2_/TRDRNA2_38553_c1_seq1.p1 gnl/TRDRNA2_/TRDRNA2_38553_c1~~gnl/TRDRNA2_/TRDRNA2_38553_c1_seq1.p1  ORF type:complete len:256 (+),score=77.07 gnl/TRDRNA2_/TRDRNA2_38553_c1_seq1:85-852(+)
MCAAARIAIFALTIVAAASRGGDTESLVSSLRNRAATAAKAVNALAPGSATHDVLKALDADGSGKVDRLEIEAFSRSQGLDTQQMINEFKGLDANGDGQLSTVEIDGVLQGVGVGSSTETSLQAAAGPIAVSSLDRDAQLRASRDLAQQFAQKAAVMLQARAKDDKNAEEFESKAKALHSNALSLVQDVSKRTSQAAQEASSKAAETRLGEIHRLEEAAANAEKMAEVHRDKARRAMQRVLQSQGDMSESVKQLN